MTAENNPRTTSVRMGHSYILKQVPIDVGVRLQHAVGFKSFRNVSCVWRGGVLTQVLMGIPMFWNIMPYRLVNIKRHQAV